MSGKTEKEKKKNTLYCNNPVDTPEKQSSVESIVGLFCKLESPDGVGFIWVRLALWPWMSTAAPAHYARKKTKNNNFVLKKKGVHNMTVANEVF